MKKYFLTTWRAPFWFSRAGVQGAGGALRLVTGSCCGSRRRRVAEEEAAQEPPHCQKRVQDGAQKSPDAARARRLDYGVSWPSWLLWEDHTHTHTRTYVMNDLLRNVPPLICHSAQWLTGSRTMEALGASSSSSKVFSRSSAVNSRLGNMVAREKCPNLLPTSCENRASYLNTRFTFQRHSTPRVQISSNA